MPSTTLSLFVRALVAGALAAAAASVPAQPAAAAAARPAVSDAWARPTVQGQAGGGGFLTITGGASADRLLAVDAPVSKAVELHRTEMDGNVMRMRAIDAIEVPAGQTVVLQPGGAHVMFIGLTQTLKRGATIPLTLRFEKAGEIRAMMAVRDGPAAAADPHAAHKH